MLQIIAGRNGFVHCTPRIADIGSFDYLMTNYAQILARLPATEHENLFFTCAHHTGIDAAKLPSRTSSTFDYQEILNFDIDYIEVDKIWEVVHVVASVLKLPTEALTLVSSGNGLQVFVQLKTPIRKTDYFAANKAAYNEICDKINAALVKENLKGEADKVVFEPARIMRLPGTRNKKKDKETGKDIIKQCSLLQYSSARVEINLFEISGIGDITKENITPHEIRRNYPRPDFPEIYKECRFIQWCVGNVVEVHEPDAFDLFSLLANMPRADKIHHDNREMTARELAQWVYDNAASSKSLAGSVFDSKMEQASKYGCRKCDTIAGRFEGCRECPHYGKIPTPLALKSPEHIGSEHNGFWIMGKNGPSQPNYSDLVKAYKLENNFVVDTSGKVVRFQDGRYVPCDDLLIKSWMERKMVPNEYTKEHMRNEFVSKVKVTGALTQAEHEALFDKSIDGKLNCKNGVIDLRTGELLPSSPNYGFKYILPYEVDIEQGNSEYFLEWLAEITMYRTDLMESVLDVMSYCLWPSYSEPMICFLSGEGANGKSTLIEIMQNIVGRGNYSTVNIHQLVNNRFAPANLDGKLMNLSEEASGGVLEEEKMNILKTLSDGGTVEVEQKNKQPYSYKNKAKMIFSVNKVPRILEQGTAIKRRLIILPFDYIVPEEKRDDSVKVRLATTEVPGITALLIRRIQENIKQHGGKFKINRKHEVLKQAQEDFLSVGNTVVLWAKENVENTLELTQESFISIDEAYAKYCQWCEDSNFEPQNKYAFGRSMTSNFLLKVGDCNKSDQKKTGNKNIRIYRYCKFKETVQ